MSWFRNDYLAEMLRDQNKRLAEQNGWLQAQVVRLTEQILEMKQQGFVHEPTFVPESMTPDLPDVVAAAIGSAAKPGSQLAGELTEWALAMLGNDVDPEHVADHLMRGASDA